jgi:hypothetical protein
MIMFYTFGTSISAGGVMNRNRHLKSVNDPRIERLRQTLQALASRQLEEMQSGGPIPIGSHKDYLQAFNRDLPAAERMTVSGIRGVLAALRNFYPSMVLIPNGGPIKVRLEQDGDTTAGSIQERPTTGKGNSLTG